MQAISPHRFVRLAVLAVVCLVWLPIAALGATAKEDDQVFNDFKQIVDAFSKQEKIEAWEAFLVKYPKNRNIPAVKKILTTLKGPAPVVRQPDPEPKEPEEPEPEETNAGFEEDEPLMEEEEQEAQSIGEQPKRKIVKKRKRRSSARSKRKGFRGSSTALGIRAQRDHRYVLTPSVSMAPGEFGGDGYQHIFTGLGFNVAFPGWAVETEFGYGFGWETQTLNNNRETGNTPTYAIELKGFAGIGASVNLFKGANELFGVATRTELYLKGTFGGYLTEIFVCRRADGTQTGDCSAEAHLPQDAENPNFLVRLLSPLGLPQNYITIGGGMRYFVSDVVALQIEGRYRLIYRDVDEDRDWLGAGFLTTGVAFQF